MTTHDAAALTHAADAWLAATPSGPTADLVRQLRDALGAAARVPDEAGLAAIRGRLANQLSGPRFDQYQGDVVALLAAVNQRDHLLADLLAQDGAALVAEGRGQMLRQVLAVVETEVARWGAVRSADAGSKAHYAECVGRVKEAADVAAALRALGPAPELLPPEAMRAEIDRLRAALREVLRETTVVDLHDGNKVLHCERLARAALGESP